MEPLAYLGVVRSLGVELPRERLWAGRELRLDRWGLWAKVWERR